MLITISQCFLVQKIFMNQEKKVIKKKICDYLYLVAGVLFFISGFIYHNSTFYILSVYFVIICIVEKNNDDKNNLD